MPYNKDIKLKTNTTMEEKKLEENKKKVLEWVRSLAQSQGFYCRVLELIENDEEALNILARQNFKDAVDMVLFLEC